jgi:hypothetical protein
MWGLRLLIQQTQIGGFQNGFPLLFHDRMPRTREIFSYASILCRLQGPGIIWLQFWFILRPLIVFSGSPFFHLSLYSFLLHFCEFHLLQLFLSPVFLNSPAFFKNKILFATWTAVHASQDSLLLLPQSPTSAFACTACSLLCILRWYFSLSVPVYKFSIIYKVQSIWHRKLQCLPRSTHFQG